MSKSYFDAILNKWIHGHGNMQFSVQILLGEGEMQFENFDLKIKISL